MTDFTDEERTKIKEFANWIYTRVMAGQRGGQERYAASQAYKALDWLSKPYTEVTREIEKAPFTDEATATPWDNRR